MSKWRTKVAAATMVVGMVGALAPAASAQPVSTVPCEAIFGEHLCMQIRETGAFANETIGHAQGAVAEWRVRIAKIAGDAVDQVLCYVSGACPIIVIKP